MSAVKLGFFGHWFGLRYRYTNPRDLEKTKLYFSGKKGFTSIQFQLFEPDDLTCLEL